MSNNLIGKVPTFDQMMNPLIKALKELGGSGTNDEIYEETIKILDLPDNILEIPHGNNSNLSEVAYRLAWTKSYLKNYGILENSSRGVWALAKNSIDIGEIDEKEVVKYVREQSSKKPHKAKVDYEDDDLKNDGIPEPEEAKDWIEKLNNILLSMDPIAFERLTQRILRESGFVQVEVTRRTGDGGIDGKGIVRLNGILSFHTVFQCKRYKGNVSSIEIRNFRGAMQGRADKGLFITTGSFTREAIKEAKRDGAPPIDLIDGEHLINILKELELGVKEIITTDYEIDEAWFEKI